MCTSIALNAPDFYFGRNLDLECGFGEQVVITPREYPFHFRKAGSMPRHYAMIGMAAIIDDYPLYAEAMNEKGLAMAGLNFPGNAWYDPKESESKANISPFELIPWLLCQCENLQQARETLARTHINAIPFSDAYPLSPLHWHIADANGSITLESTRNGIQIHENPVGVLTNNPPFDFHLQNLSQYRHLSAHDTENLFSAAMDLTAFSRAMGAIGLPGDFSSASRFVKAAFVKCNSRCENTPESAVSQFFHLLDSVAMPRGSVMLPGGIPDITQYSCCMQKNGCIFYYKTYDNQQITAVEMMAENLDTDVLIAYPLQRSQQIHWENKK